MKSSRHFLKIIFAVILIVGFAPAQLFACAACGSGNPNIDSPLATGMNWGIFTLLGVVGTMLASIASFFIYLVHRAARLANQNPIPENPVEA